MAKRISLTDNEMKFLLKLCLLEDNARNKAYASAVFAEEGLAKLIEKLDPTLKPKTDN